MKIVIGAYLKLSNNAFKKEFYEELQCPIHSHIKDGKYCMLCGSKLESVKIEYVVDLFECWDEFEDIDGDLFFSQGEDYSYIFIQNYKSLKYTYHICDDYIPIKKNEYSLYDMNTCKDEFEEKYSKDIQIIRDYFNDVDGELLTIEYGILYIDD